MTETSFRDRAQRAPNLRGVIVSDEEIAKAAKKARRVAYAIARKGGHIEIADELEAAAYETLAAAVRLYDDSYGVPFQIYAWHRMHGGCWDAYRSWYGRRGVNMKLGAARLDPFVESWAERKTDHMVDYVTPEEQVLGRLELEELAVKLAQLSFSQREALLASARGETMLSVAGRLGVTESRVSQLRSEAMRRLSVSWRPATHVQAV